ncbi:MAG: anti-sigma factor, partial [Flavobacteriaceae bacterium]
MKKEDLIIKWLDNSLDEKEQKAFEQLDASSSFKKLDAALQHFKAPAFDVENQFQKLQAAKAANNQAFPIR